ncbi:NDP-sugar synthase [Candidatus Woesearchaeota archaeon]|nr:NDP-sugar synthase [Candidatus Woesearchaeota archaeon]
MEPLILIAAAGEGKRLYPLTKDTPKPFVDIGDEKLIDKVAKALPKGIKKAVLIKRTRKFKGLERHLVDKLGFQSEDILYQDRITASPYLPGSLNLSELPLAYYLGFFPPAVSRNSAIIRQFDPIIFVPGDIIVEGLDYFDMLRFHHAHASDVTMPMQEGFVRGSNTRIYKIENGMVVSASQYVNPPLSKQLEENERVYTHEGTYVLGRQFFDLPLSRWFRKDHITPPFDGAYQSLKFVPYEGIFEWIDIRNIANLAAARARFGTDLEFR